MAQYDMDDLIAVMRRLRDPDTGCPWDLQQDFRSLVRHTLEEVYELVDAIEHGDSGQVRDELGDYLFQAVFYAQIAEEDGLFSFGEVVSGIVGKLLRRHPHVFPQGTLESSRSAQLALDSSEIHEQWETIKDDDRRARELHSRLDDVPRALPAMQRAEKLQRRAARAGFDWNHWRGVVEKVQEEIEELTLAAEQGDASGCEEELGDLLFSCVNLARHLGVDAEVAMRGANAKFERRFRDMEAELAARGLRPEDCDLATLDDLWEAAKQAH